ncbi:MAG TPA: LysR substrate-binding domain-containing protein [Sphingopyxis sp.]|uniref:LysR family transcriptional regulator n=1 Tax=Sphingopyxis sp. TaxID=1908224 RepID=UPI002BEC5C66|nr:LysR substrate-binding domain-containing protein [Sphingopyxis sp.]HWW57551.1 LysR substrate-binding domain-containing protein [Sphingopyxis sp.]
MDSSLLEDFLTLIDCGNFSRAAEKRAVSQPSFSRRIRTLEEWVGAVLIDRSTHTVRLTAAGDRFRTTAEETLRRLQLGREEARAVAKASSETLRFASTHVLSLTFFPSWLRSLEIDAQRNVTIELIADNMVACERLMIEGRAQFLLCHHHEAANVRLGSDFRSVRLGSDILLPVAAPQVVASGITADTPQLAFTSDSGMGRILASAWATKGLPPKPQPAFASHLASVLAAMARDGRGVTWSALSLVEDDLAAGRLVRAGGESDEVPIEIRLWRPKARQSPAAEAFWSRLLKIEAANPA